MTGFLDIQVDAQDVQRQAELLARFDQIATRHFRPAAEFALEHVVGGFRSEAPVARGDYVDSITGKIEKVIGLDVVGIASASARRDGSFPYPAALETSKRYHLRVSGRATKGTMRRMLKSKGEVIMQRFWQALEATLRDLVVP